MRLPFAILLAASALIGVVGASAPAFAAPACVTLDATKQKAREVGASSDNIMVVADVGFLKAYTSSLGLGIPTDSNPRAIIFVNFPNMVFVGLVEQDDCVRYSAPVPISAHERALKAAKESV